MKYIKNNKERWLLIPIYGLYCLIGCLTEIGCVWKKIFGIPCPGCGFTRAVFCMLSLDFKTAFSYHPMFWSSIILALYFVFDGHVFKNKLVNKIVILSIIALFFITWIVRLVIFGRNYI